MDEPVTEAETEQMPEAELEFWRAGIRKMQIPQKMNLRKKPRKMDWNRTMDEMIPEEDEPDAESQETEVSRKRKLPWTWNLHSRSASTTV